MKQLHILSFGNIAEATGTGEFVLEAVDTDSLQLLLLKRFPALARKKFAIAVNKKLINVNTVFTDDAVIALLPPFSGG
jgi:molybdopterin synthase sulfur carrier subunit